MKPIEEKVLRAAVTNGVHAGYECVAKHHSSPDEETTKRYVVETVLQEIYKWFE